MAEVDLKNKRLFSRSSHQEVFCRRGLLKYFGKVQRKTSIQEHDIVYESYFPKNISINGLKLQNRLREPGMTVAFLILFESKVTLRVSGRDWASVHICEGARDSY